MSKKIFIIKENVNMMDGPYALTVEEFKNIAYENGVIKPNFKQLEKGGEV